MDIETLQDLRSRSPLGSELVIPTPDPVPFGRLHAIGLPVVAARGAPTTFPWESEELVLRAAPVGAYGYPRSTVADALATQPGKALELVSAHLAVEPDCGEAWLDGARCAAGIGAVDDARVYLGQAIQHAPAAPELPDIARRLGVSPPRLTARDRLEGWLVGHRHVLCGPMLDVGTSRSERTWLDRIGIRMTLDVCEAVYNGSNDRPDIVADLEDLSSIPDDVFGSVLCTEVLEHVAHPVRALTELRRVTRPDGSLLLSVPWFYPFHPCPLDLRRFTLQGLVHALEEAGWTVVEADGLKLPVEAHQRLVEAVQIMTGRPSCPNPQSIGFSNWTVHATA